MSLAKASEPAYGIARLIGEGYGKPDGKEETPIDIPYAKIAEWLVRDACCIRSCLYSSIGLPWHEKGCSWDLRHAGY